MLLHSAGWVVLGWSMVWIGPIDHPTLPCLPFQMQYTQQVPCRALSIPVTWSRMLLHTLSALAGLGSALHMVPALDDQEPVMCAVPILVRLGSVPHVIPPLRLSCGSAQTWGSTGAGQMASAGKIVDIPTLTCWTMLITEPCKNRTSLKWDFLIKIIWTALVIQYKWLGVLSNISCLIMGYSNK